MDNRSTAIEFKSHPFHSDMEDISQECAAYMKTKQFMAKRIHEQQEEIEILKQNVIYHSGKHIQKEEMLLNMCNQVQLIKKNISKKNKEEKEKEKDNFDISNENLASSFVYEENFENCEDHNYILNENLELKKEIERLSIEVLDTNIELNKSKSDKFILYNELNELVMSLRKIEIEKLNSFYKKNITYSNLNKFEMPIARGIKFNILSAQSQLCKIMITDSIIKKLNKQDDNLNMDDGILQNSSTKPDLVDKTQMEVYYKLLKKNEEEFDYLLDRKLSKRTNSNFC